MNALNEQRKETAAKLVIGHRFGRCIALEGTDQRESNSRVYVFRCDCGTLFERAIGDVRRSQKRGAAPACPGCARNVARQAPRLRYTITCEDCAGLPHRRPVDRLCECKGAFREEAMPTVTSNRIGGQPWL